MSETALQHQSQLLLVHGDYYGLATWSYVLVDRLKMPLLARRPKGAPPVDLAECSEIICSGWGHQPPPDTVRQMQERFGA